MGELVVVRALRKGLRFELATNEAGIKPFGMLLNLYSHLEGAPNCITYLVRLTPSYRKEDAIHTGELTNNSGVYSVKKYFQVFKNLKNHLAQNRDLFGQRSLDDCRFVITTTLLISKGTRSHREDVHNFQPDVTDTPEDKSQTNQSEPTQTGEHQSDIDFPHADLLDTSDGKGVFFFSCADGDVWTLFDGTQDEKIYKEEFLPRLRFYTKQKNLNGLDTLLCDELSKYLGLDQHHSKSFAHNHFLPALKKWDNGATLMTERTGELEDSLRDYFNEMYDTPLDQDVYFKSEICKELSDKIGNNRFVHLSVPGVAPEFRFLKIVQALKLQQAKCLRLYLSILETNQIAVRKICKYLTSTDAVLLNIDRNDISSSDVIKELISNHQCKFITVSSNKKDSLLCSSDSDSFIEIVDAWSLSQLTAHSQAYVLGQVLSFQGRRVQLRALQGAWPSLAEDVDGAALSALLHGHATICAAPSDAHHYVPRRLHHTATLHADVLRLDSSLDLIAVSNCPRHLQAEGLRVLSYEGDNSDMEEDKREFNKLCLATDSRNVHHLRYKNGYFIWMDTLGNTSKLKQYLPSTDCILTSHVCIHDELPSWRQNTMFLSGEPGMGKSTFVAEQAARENVNGVRWRILVPLASHRKYLNKLPVPNNMNIGHVMGLLADAAKINTSPWGDSAWKFLKVSWKKGIDVYLDGLDEIFTTYKEQITRIIEVLQNLRNVQLLIVARSHLDEDLKKLIHNEPIQLIPFSQGEQINHIASHLTHKKQFKRVVEEVQNMCEDINKKIQQENKNGICGIPLHTMLIMDWLEDQKSNHFTVFTLYENFIGKKIDIYTSKQFGPNYDKNLPGVLREKAYFFNVHKHAALLTVLELEGVCDREGAERTIKEFAMGDETLNTGVMHLKDGVPVFVHHTFAEFFAALWLRDNLTRVTEAVWEGLPGPVRYFLDSALAGGRPAHTAAIEGKTLTGVGHCHDADDGGRTPLHLACAHANLEACRALLEQGCGGCDDCAGARDRVLGWTPLQYADAHDSVSWTWGYGEEHLDLSELVLSARKRTSPPRGDAHRTLEKNAKAKEEILENTKKMCLVSNENPPLHEAAATGHMDVVQSLVEAGASINVRNKLRETPLYLAAEMGHEGVVECLLASGAFASVGNAARDTPLHAAVRNGHAGVCARLLDAGACVNARSKRGVTPLWVAVKKGREELARLLLRRRASVRARDQYGATPLHEASRNGHTDLVRALMDAGANVDATDSALRTPLHWAAQEGSLAAVQALLDSGADVNARTRGGETALALARGSQLKEVILLLERASTTAR